MAIALLAAGVSKLRARVAKWARWKEEGKDVRIAPRSISEKLLEIFDLNPTLERYREPFFPGRDALHAMAFCVQVRYKFKTLSGDS